MATYYQRLQALQAQKLANAQKQFQAHQQAAEQAAAAKAKLEQDKMDARALADQLQKKAIWDRLVTSTNSSWNLQKARQAAAEKKPTIKVTTESKDGTKTVRDLTPAEHAAEIRAKNAPEVAALQAELDDQAKEMAAGDKRYGIFNLFSRDKKVAELKKQMAELQPPGDMLSADPVAAAAAAMPATPMTSKSPFDFNGTTSLSGHGFAPVQSRGFIGTPGGANAFRNNWDPVEAAAVMPQPDMTQGSYPSGYEPGHGAFQMDSPAESVAEPVADPVEAAAAVAPVAEDLRRGRPAVVNLEDPTVGDPVVAPKIPNSHIKHLLANPDTAKFFNQKYGEGAAEKLLEVDRQP